MSKIPTIAMIPSAYKANKVYSVLPTNGDADLDFVRASTKTRVNQIGLVEDLATGVPALDYSDGGCPSLLLEPQSTNLITYSEDFSNAIWTASAGGTAVAPVVTTNQGLSPKGDNSADRVVFDLSGGSASADLSALSETVAVTSGATTTKSIYLKSNTLEDYDLIIYDGATGDAISVKVTQEWQRFSLTNSVPSTSSSIVFGLRNVFGVTTSDTADILVWGVQLEEHLKETSYIPTSGATATRVLESLSKTGLSSYINSNEGVVFLESSAFSNNLTKRYFSITDGTLLNRVTLAYESTSNTIAAFIVVAGVTKSLVYNSSDITAISKIALKWKKDDFSLWVDGVERSSSLSGDTFTTNILSDIVSNRGNGSDTFFGEIRDFRIYNEVLTDTELQTLTS